MPVHIKARVSQGLIAFCCLLTSSITYAGAFERLFAPKAEPWPVWEQHQPSSTQTIDHSSWNGFLQANVKPGNDGIHRLAYATISAADKQALADYVKAMQAVRIHQYSRPEQFAYWVNLYNAVTVDVVLQHYPVKTIRDIDISPGLFADGPWGKKLLSIEGENISLNDIEHRILRPVWKNPLVHYVVNCASLGCPNLHKSALTSATSSDILDTAARAYINHPRGVRIQGKDVYVSSIYSWFQDDFGDSEADVISHLMEYAEPVLADKLKGIEFFAGDDYDWSLNDASLEK